MTIPYPSIREKLKEAEKNSIASYQASVGGIGIHFELVQDVAEWLLAAGLLTDKISLDYDNWNVSIQFEYNANDDTWKEIYALLRRAGFGIMERTPEDLNFKFMKPNPASTGNWDAWDYEAGTIILCAEFPDTCVVEKIGEEEVVTTKAIYRRNCGELGNFDPKTLQEPSDDWNRGPKMPVAEISGEGTVLRAIGPEDGLEDEDDLNDRNSDPDDDIPF